MPNYNIAGIKLAFNYHFDDYFNNNLEHYLTDETKMDYQMNVHIKDFIPLIEGSPDSRFKNGAIYYDNQRNYIVSYDKNHVVKQMVVHTDDYKEIDIYLLKSLGKQLPELEYIFTGMLFLELAVIENKLPLHGSAFAYQHKAFIFSAPSQTGKSTHTAYWMAQDNDIVIINDDKPLIYKENDSFVVSGSPWSGAKRLNKNVCYPLDTIIFLNRGRNEVHSLTNKEKVNLFLKNCVRPRNEKLMDNVLSLVEALIQEVSVISYDAANSIDSVNPIKDYLCGGTHEDKK